MQVRKGVVAATVMSSLAAGSIGAWLFAPASGNAASTSTTSPGAAAHSKEDPAHEKGESAPREADENAGKVGGRHGRETPVTGAIADKIKAAALAAVPGTVNKTEQRADGSYEAEITKTDGSEAHVSLDKNFVVTSTNYGHHGQRDSGDATPGA
jgi:hypothetical protein